MKVWVTVFTRLERDGWVHPKLAINLCQMVTDTRFEVVVNMIQEAPLPYARNLVVQRARDSVKPDWVLMSDNDQSFDFNPLDILPTAEGKPVIGIPTLMSASKYERERGQLVKPNTTAVVLQTEKDGKLGEVERIGGGVILIHRTVWETIPKGPWFKFSFDIDNELDEVTLTEDYYFSELIHKHGLTTWIVNRVASHHHTIDLLYAAKHIRM